MQIVEGYQDLGAAARGAVAAIGNFDGVHKGHQALIASVREEAARLSAPSAVITFEPHPRRYFQPDAPGFRLTSAAEKARILDALGIDLLYILSFDAALAAMPAESFVADVLAGGLGITHLVVGEDFRFGKGRTGDALLLRQMGERLGFGCTIHHLLGDGGAEYSSTAVRVMIEQGRVAEAAAALGRWHSVSGTVIQGDRRGRELGYPTANISLDDLLIPRFGIYAVEVRVHDGPHAGDYTGVASAGERPTFGINAPNFEVHLFDFDGDLYGAELSAGLVAFLRDEVRFESVDALIAQMDRDAAEARSILASAPVPG